MQNISLDNWIKEGHGFTADSYRHKDDNTLLLKLFFTDNGKELAAQEFKTAKAVVDMSIPTPMVYELVEVDGKAGIVYERILDKKSFGVLCTENPDKLPEYAKLFAYHSRKLHERKCKTDKFPSRKEALAQLVEKVELEESVREYLRGLLAALEDVDTCLHGDLQTGNLVMGWCNGFEGHYRTANDEEQCYFIDLATFSYGDPVLDIAELYLSTMVYTNVETNIEILHMQPELLLAFWKNYAPAYIGSDDPAALEAFEKRVAPYAMFFLLQIIDAAEGAQPVTDIAREHIEKLYKANGTISG